MNKSLLLLCAVTIVSVAVNVVNLAKVSTIANRGESPVVTLPLAPVPEPEPLVIFMESLPEPAPVVVEAPLAPPVPLPPRRPKRVAKPKITPALKSKSTSPFTCAVCRADPGALRPDQRLYVKSPAS